MFDDIALFIHIAEQRSLGAAAIKLGLPAATVTRRLKKLEQQLGCQLVNRSSRQFYLTAEGEVYYREYAELVQAMEAKQRFLDRNQRLLSGPLKVLAPTNISIGFLQPMWSGFIKAYPDIQLDLCLSNQTLDMVSTQADLALRIGPQPDSALYQKRLGSLDTILVASPSYLINRRAIESLDDLYQQRIILVRNIPVWPLKQQANDKPVDFRVRPAVSVDDIRMATLLAVDGVGVTLLPITEVVNELNTGQLSRVLPSWSGPNRDLFAIWPSGRLMNEKTKCCRDFMAEYIAQSKFMARKGADIR